jgi:dienelactone hydrolase
MDAPYVENGESLVGRVCKPQDANASVPVPAIVIMHDADGISAYEKERMNMIVNEMGYVAFAADIFGDEGKNMTSDIRSELLTKWRGNVTRYVSRMQAAINETKAMAEVDSDKVAIIGYCFGGTGVLAYALSGMDDVSSVVSFHGGLRSGIPEPGPDVKVDVLVQSGGEDDTATNIEMLEASLNATSAPSWEIVRYSGVEHGFTNFYDTRGSYNQRADERSWESMKTFLWEVHGGLTHESNQPLAEDVADSVIPVTYQDVNGELLDGYVAYPSATALLNASDISIVVEKDASLMPLPAIIVIPDWDGPTMYEKERVTMLADMGYVGFAADIFGNGYVGEAMSMMDKIGNITKFYGDMDLFMTRIEAAITQVKSDPLVDSSKIALIGYCFGGSGVMAYAISGREDVEAIASFHGGIDPLTATDATIYPHMLVQSGGSDDLATSIDFLEKTLNGGNAPWEIARYSGVEHGYTNFGTGVYNLRADARGWAAFETFIEESFNATYAKSPAVDVSGESGNVDNMGLAADGSAAPIMNMKLALGLVVGFTTFLAATV